MSWLEHNWLSMENEAGWWSVEERVGPGHYVVHAYVRTKQEVKEYAGDGRIKFLRYR